MFVYDLCNNVVNSSHDPMNWKECIRKWLWPDIRYHSDICLQKLRKTTDKTFVDGQTTHQNFNLEPQKHTARKKVLVSGVTVIIFNAICT